MNDHPPPSILRRNNGHRLSIHSATRSLFRSSHVFDPPGSTPSFSGHPLLGSILNNHNSSSATSHPSNGHLGPNANANANTNNAQSLGSAMSAAASSAAKRRSLLLTPASKRRQSSMAPQAPPFGHLSSQTPSQTPSQLYLGAIGLSVPLAAPSLAADPRPLRDKNYISLIQQEIYDFLSVNRFEVDTNHALTQKTLRQPTQRDFVVIFQFIYHKIDPFHRFAKSIDTEVFAALRTLGYPYLDTLNRSQVASVNAQNWPNILAMLYWLVKLNLAVLSIAMAAGGDVALNNAPGPSAAALDEYLLLLRTENLSLFDAYDEKLDQIFITFTRDAYRAYLKGEDDNTPYFEQMKQQYDEFTANLLDDIARLEDVNLRLSKEFKELEGQLKLLEYHETNLRDLEADLVLYKAYVETVEQVKLKREAQLVQLEEELQRQQLRLKELETDKQTIQARLQERGLTIAAIDLVLNERDALSRAINRQQDQIDSLNNEYQNMEIECHKRFESLNNFINQYNSLIHKMHHDTNNELALSSEHDFKLRIGDNLLNNGALAHEPLLILHDRRLGDEKHHLERYRADIRKNVNDLERKLIEILGEADVMQETIYQQRDQLEAIQDDLLRSVVTSENLKENVTNIQYLYALQIGQLQNEIKNLKFNSNKEALLESENLLRKIETDYELITRDVNLEKEELHRRVVALIDEVIQFKIDIQKDLEALDMMVVEDHEVVRKRADERGHVS